MGYVDTQAKIETVKTLVAHHYLIHHEKSGPCKKNQEESVSEYPKKTLKIKGRTHSENYVSIGYEAKSAKDGAWYDVGSFINNRKVETGNPEVLVRFGGFGEEEDEWLDVRTQIRPSSIPCEPSECAVVLPGDLILCFLEGKEQALYMDAHVVDVQRWRHDVRGCRCRFTVRYDHDQSEEVVSLRKLCRRPETDFRLQLMYASKDLGSVNLQDMKKDPSLGGTSKDFNSPKTRKNRRQKGKASEKMVVNTIPSSGTAEPITTEAARIMKTENFDDGKVGISGERIGGAPPVIFSTAATSTGSGSGGFGGSGTGAGKST